MLDYYHIFPKHSKYIFGQSLIEILGHVILDLGVNLELSKLWVMKDWPMPATIRELSAFLGLTRFYRKFIKGYAITASPLTDLLKKDGFIVDGAPNSL